MPGSSWTSSAAVAHLHEQGFADGAIGIVGFCMGGRVTFLASLELAPRRGGRLLRRRHRHRPVPAVPAADRSRRRAADAVARAVRRRGRLDPGRGRRAAARRSSTASTCPTEVVRYAGAEHGFHCDVRPSYNAEAATDAWARTLAWFEEHLEPATDRGRRWQTPAMGDVLEALDEKLIEWIGQQHVFFVATAPAEGGHVNLSPKGHDALRGARRPTTVAYLDLTGSGAETIAHTRENGRMTIMFCAFEGPPRILRLYGQGEAHPLGSPRYEELVDRFDPIAGARAIIELAIERVQTSCGYSDPVHGLPGGAAHPPAVGRAQGRRRPAGVLGREEHREHRRPPRPRPAIGNRAVALRSRRCDPGSACRPRWPTPPRGSTCAAARGDRLRRDQRRRPPEGRRHDPDGRAGRRPRPSPSGSPSRRWC